MNRRSILLGMGTAAAGAGAVFGSGAFTQVQTERELTIGVEKDSAALLELNASSGVASVANGGNGELVIDTDRLSSESESNSQGFAVGSTVEIGEIDGGDVSSDGAAFTLTNNFDDVGDGSADLDVGIDLTNIDLSTVSGLTSLEFYGTPSNGNETQVTSAGGRNVFDVASGEKIDFAIKFTTASTTGPTGLDDATVAFQAGSDLTSGDFPTPQPVVVRSSDGASFTSIQDAISDDGTGSGETLTVGAGTFNESVTVDVEGLTLEGPNAGIAGDSAERGAEAVITQRVLIDDADDVTLNGFTVEQDVAGEDGQESVVRVGENLGVEDRTFVTGITLNNNVITATPTTDDTLTAVGIEAAVDMTVTNNQITQTSFTGDLVGVGNYKSEITNLEISQNTIETQLGVQLGDSSGLSRTATISENTINSTQRAVTADEGSNLTIDGNSIGGIEGESFEGDEYQQITAFSGSEVTITNNDFTAGADTGEYVADAIGLDTNAILNQQGNTFDPDAEIDGGFIVPTSQ